jgi:hypothetical protein
MFLQEPRRSIVVVKAASSSTSSVVVVEADVMLRGVQIEVQKSIELISLSGAALGRSTFTSDITTIPLSVLKGVFDRKS